MKTTARIVKRVNCPGCDFPMHVKHSGDKPTVVCTVQTCKQVGVEFYAPVEEIKLVAVAIGH